jgi:Na+-transporting NADH:ubiquinone oxidoreductase subunit NqrD
MNETLIYIGCIILIIWGIAHIIPIKSIIKGFGEISADNKKVLVMSYVGEGLTLIFLGILPLLILTGGWPLSVNGLFVYRAEAIFLLVLAVWTLVTGGRMPTIWYKICPAVKTAVALLFIFAVI